MKQHKILIHSSMFIADLKRDFQKLLENLDKEKYNVYSPVAYVLEDNYYQLMGAVIALEDFNPSEINNKVSIYFGPASSSLSFDYTITVNPIVVDAQEAYVELNFMKFLRDANMLNGLHKSSNSDVIFNTLDEAITFLNKEY